MVFNEQTDWLCSTNECDGSNVKKCGVMNLETRAGNKCEKKTEDKEEEEHSRSSRARLNEEGVKAKAGGPEGCRS